jgi:hypothetical protein
MRTMLTRVNTLIRERMRRTVFLSLAGPVFYPVQSEPGDGSGLVGGPVPLSLLPERYRPREPAVRLVVALFSD